MTPLIWGSTNELTKQRLTDFENEFMVAGGKIVGRG